MAIVSQKIGPISAYAIAKEEGYTGTKAEFATEIANAAANAQTASTAATNAEASATSAATSASNAMSTTPTGYNSMMASIAAEYDPDNGVYAVGDYCRYNSAVYRCTTAVTAAEAFDSTKWSAVTIGGEISSLSDEITDTNSAINSIYTEMDEGSTQVSLIWTQSEYIKPSTGGTVAAGGTFYSTEDFYPINKNAYKTVVNHIHAYSGVSCSVAFYSSAAESAFISCIETDSPVLTSSNIPQTANYMRFCHQTANDPVADVTCVEYFFERVKTIEDTAETALERANAFAQNYSEPTIKDVYTDKTVIAGKRPKTTSGATMDEYFDASNVNCSKPFAVLPSTKYTFAEVSTAYKAISSVPTAVETYNSSGVHIQSYNNISNPFQTPEGCYYMAFYVGNDRSVANFYVENTEELQMPFDNKIFNDQAKTSLFGKKWLVFGDSITDNNTRAAGNYHDFIRAETGCVVINEGISGAGYYQTGGVKSIPTAISDYDGDTPDLVTIMAGINDIMFAVDYDPQILPIGVYTDTGTSSLMGYVYAAYQAILTKFPLTTFAIISPLPEKDYPQTDTENSLLKFVQELKKFCDYYGIPFLDQYTQSPLRPWVSTYNAKYFSSNNAGASSGDGVHPNYYGHQLFYPKIREFIKTLL